MFEGFELDAGLWVGVIAAVVSVVSLVSNIGLTRRAQRFAAESLRLDIDRHLITWAESVLAVMGRASQIAAASSPDASGLATARSDVLRDLSVLLDSGRWHAPNTPDPKHGADKPAAYRGYRQRALDCIFAVYNAIERGAPEGQDLQETIWDARRHFVSEVQTLTDPRRRREFLRRAEMNKSIA